MEATRDEATRGSAAESTGRPLPSDGDYRRTLLDGDGASQGYGTAAPHDNGDMPLLAADVDAVAAEIEADGDGRTAAALRGVINRRNGRLYASKPRKVDAECGYLWRMLAFHLSRKPEHHCMPVTADLAMGPRYQHGESAEETRIRHEARRKRCRELDAVVGKVADRVPPRRQHGILRWARALGR